MWNKATGAVNTYKSALDEATAAASRLAAASGGGGGGGGGTSATKPTFTPQKPGFSSNTDKLSGITGTMDYQYIIKNRKTGQVMGGPTTLPIAQNLWDRLGGPNKGMSGELYFEKWLGGKKVNMSYVRPYHRGLDAGFVGNLKGNEEFVKALKGEAFVTRAQQDRFMNNILPDIVSKTSTYGGATFDNLLNINVQGNLDSSVVPDIERISNDVFKRLNKAMFQGGYKRNTNTVSI